MPTLKGTTMHPRCRHIGACCDLLECWFQLFSTSQNTSQIQFQTFLKKKIKFFGSHVVVLVKTFPLTYQLLMWDWYQYSQGDFFSRRKESRGTDKIQFHTFLKKQQQILGFQCCSTREDLSIDVSITNIGLILTKLRWFQLFVKSQNLNFELFWKKNQIFGVPWCSTSENLSIDVSINNVGLILTKLRWFQLFVKSQNSNFFEKKIKFLGFHGVVLVETFPLMYQLLM